MAKSKDVFVLIGILCGLSVVGSVVNSINPEFMAVPPPPPEKHDCSGAMKEAMLYNPGLAAKRKELCDDGGEARVDAYIKEKIDARNAKAF